MLTKHIPYFEPFRDENPNFNVSSPRNSELPQQHDGCKECIFRTWTWMGGDGALCWSLREELSPSDREKIVPYHHQEWNWGNNLSVAWYVRDDISEVVWCGSKIWVPPKVRSMSEFLELVALFPSMAKGLCRCESVKHLEMGCSCWSTWVAPASSQ